MKLEFMLNGEAVEIEAPASVTLLHLLRESRASNPVQVENSLSNSASSRTLATRVGCCR